MPREPLGGSNPVGLAIALTAGIRNAPLQSRGFLGGCDAQVRNPRSSTDDTHQQSWLMIVPVPGCPGFGP